jgi:multiple sugar transport system permease protein
MMGMPAKRLQPRSSPVFDTLRHIVLGTGAMLMVAPFVLMVSISLKTEGEIYSPSFHLLPDSWDGLSNYVTAFSMQPLARYLLNGVIICASIFAAQILFALPCAYALAKLRWRGRDTSFALVLLGLLIPQQAIAVPVYIMMWKLQILDSYSALILPSTISVFGIFMMRQFFRTVPNDLLDAARMDGLSELAIVWRVMLPSAIPALVAFGILSVVGHWNEFFWPLIVVQTQNLATPALGILFFSNAELGTNYGHLMAAAVVVNAPLVIAFLVAQRWFIDGVTMSSLK